MLGVIALLSLLTAGRAWSESLASRSLVPPPADDSGTENKTFRPPYGTAMLVFDGKDTYGTLGSLDGLVVTKIPIPSPAPASIILIQVSSPRPWWRDPSLSIAALGTAMVIYCINQGKKKSPNRPDPPVPPDRSNTALLPKWDDHLVIHLAQKLLTIPDDAVELAPDWKNAPKSYRINSAPFRVKKSEMKCSLAQAEVHQKFIHDLREALARGGHGTERTAWKLELERHVEERQANGDQLRSMLQEMLE